MRTLASRMARLEGRSPHRLIVATVARGSSIEAVAAEQQFELRPSDLLVTICKPEGCKAGTIKTYGGEG